MPLSDYSDPRDEFFMQQALLEAEKAFLEDEVPVGAIIVSNGKIIARAHNQTQQFDDVTAHAEIIALTAASAELGSKYLPQCSLYVTVEPCIMCAGALGWAQIGRIVYGTSDPKKGFTKFCNEGLSPLHPKTIVSTGILNEECAEIMKDFFRKKRGLK